MLEVARRAHKMPYPPNWSEELDAASGALYFYHGLKDEASWEHPLAVTFRSVIELVEGMVASRTNLGNMAVRIEQELAERQKCAAEELADWVGPIPAEDGSYYCNNRTGESVWEDPREQHRFDLQVRYELLVGFLVAEERASAAHFGTGIGHAHRDNDLTPTLTSLASTMSSVNSLLTNSLTPPADALRQRIGSSAISGGGEESGESHWARPRPLRRGGLPLPPRAVTPVAEPAAARQSSRAIYGIAPHQQRYTSDVLQQGSPGGSAASPTRSPGGGAPPPPPGSPPLQRLQVPPTRAPRSRLLLEPRVDSRAAPRHWEASSSTSDPSL